MNRMEGHEERSDDGMWRVSYIGENYDHYKIVESKTLAQTTEHTRPEMPMRMKRR